jgi:uncharacterized membrane protein YphA (DoxX/SURF4 family)
MTTNQRTSKALNIALWTAQVVLFVAFGMAGVMKSTMPVEQLSQNMAWVPRFSPGVVRFIGISELCGAIGVLVPSITRIAPPVTPLAALGLTAVMILAAGHHAMNNEAGVIPIPLFLGVLAAFVGWGRWKKAPIAPRVR